MNLNVIQEHKEFFTKEKINGIKKRLHENNEITFYIFFRDREGIDKTIEKDIRGLLPEYYRTTFMYKENKGTLVEQRKHIINIILRTEKIKQWCRNN